MENAGHYDKEAEEEYLYEETAGDDVFAELHAVRVLRFGEQSAAWQYISLDFAIKRASSDAMGRTSRLCKEGEHITKHEHLREPSSSND